MPCGTDVMTPTYSCAIRRSTPSERPSHEPPSRKSQTRAARRRRQRPKARPSAGSKRSEERWRRRARRQDQRRDGVRREIRLTACDVLPGKIATSEPDLRADHRLLCPGELGHDHVHAGGAFVRHVLSSHDDDRGHDQRWRERPRRGVLGPPTGQDTGVVHASVGSATATPAPVATAAQSAALAARSRQVAAIESLERGSWSRSHQG